MRFILIVFLTVSVLVMRAATATAQHRNGEIRGEIMYPDTRPCGSCQVRMESMGMAVASALTDSFGRFLFTGVNPGRQQLRLSVEGFEAIDLLADADYMGSTPLNIIMLTPKRVIQKSQDQVVDVSAFLNQYPKKATDLQEQARKLQRKGIFAEAVKRLEQAIQIAPEFYQARVDLGLLYLKAGRVNEAEMEFLAANGLNPSGAEPLIYLSRSYMHRNERALAVDAAEEAVSRNPRSASALFNLGFVLYSVSKLDSAENALNRALSLAPHAAPVRLLLADVYAMQRDWHNMQVQLESYLEENPDGAEREAVQQARKQLVEAKDENE